VTSPLTLLTGQNTYYVDVSGNGDVRLFAVASDMIQQQRILYWTAPSNFASEKTPCHQNRTASSITTMLVSHHF